MIAIDDGFFQEFAHCRLKDHVVKMVAIPSLEKRVLFVCVNKFGFIGLYGGKHFSLLHTFGLDLQIVISGERKRSCPLREPAKILPKCQRTHLVVDACYAHDIKCVVFATSRGVLILVDVGEIERQSIGLGLFREPRYRNVEQGENIVSVKHFGLVETHRVHGFPYSITGLTYHNSGSDSKMQSVVGGPKNIHSCIVIGTACGHLIIIDVEDTKFPFGKRKIRGQQHKLTFQELSNSGIVRIFNVSSSSLKQLKYIPSFDVMVGCSEEDSFKAFWGKNKFFPSDRRKDAEQGCINLCFDTENTLMLLLSGTSCISFSEDEKLGAACGLDKVLRVFALQQKEHTAFIELLEHKDSIRGCDFIQHCGSRKSFLVSFSANLELRLWDIENYECIQVIYPKLPSKSCGAMKNPNFGTFPCTVYQAHRMQHLCQGTEPKPYRYESVPSMSEGYEPKGLFAGSSANDNNDFVILIFGNRYTALKIYSDQQDWLGHIFDESLSLDERAVRRRTRSSSRNSNPVEIKPTKPISQCYDRLITNHVSNETFQLKVEEGAVIENRLRERAIAQLNIKKSTDDLNNPEPLKNNVKPIEINDPVVPLKPGHLHLEDFI